MYKAQLRYDGTRYFGWQRTITGPSIQEELEQALFRITSETVQPEAASRTDRGVHARGQIVQFALKSEFAQEKLLRALNAHLPEDIRIVSLAPNSRTKGPGLFVATARTERQPRRHDDT